MAIRREANGVFSCDGIEKKDQAGDKVEINAEDYEALCKEFEEFTAANPNKDFLLNDEQSNSCRRFHPSQAGKIFEKQGTRRVRLYRDVHDT